MRLKYAFLIFVLTLSCFGKIYSAIYSEQIDTTLQAFSTFPFGAYLSEKNVDNEMYMKRAVEEYSSITTGTMKMSTIRPQMNKYDFSGSDYWINFAEKYGKRVHGHVLIRKDVPDWVLNFVGDSIAWENFMKDHIITVVGHYKGRVASWDVVNEAVADDGSIKTDNVWYQHLGAGYIERAFIYAHEADPNALLFYNDYGHEYSDTRLNAIVNMLKRFKTKGIPVHGIGMQMHTRYNLGDERWKNAINVAASTGLKIHISELDISVNSSPVDLNAVFTPEIAMIQGDKYKYIVNVYNSLPDSQKFGITTWGVGDKDTWIRGTYKRPEWPLPFDDNYERKPAYYGILEGLGVNIQQDQSSQTSLWFETAFTGYPTSYNFKTGDILYLSQGRNSSSSGTCEGSVLGTIRPNRVQDHTFIIELRSTSLQSIAIYGKSSSSTDRILHKIEVGESLNGSFTDITSSASIVNLMQDGNCGRLLANGLDIPVGSFVRFAITLSDGATLAPTNVSEFLISGIKLTDSISPVTANKSIVGKHYYSVLGSKITNINLVKGGVLIEKIVYSDGSESTIKVFNSNIK